MNGYEMSNQMISLRQLLSKKVPGPNAEYLIGVYITTILWSLEEKKSIESIADHLASKLDYPVQYA